MVKAPLLEGHSTIPTVGFLPAWIEKTTIYVCSTTLKNDRGKPFLLNASLAAVGARLHESAVSVLAEEGSVRELDCKDFVISDHHAGLRKLVGLEGAGDRLKVPLDSAFLGSSHSLVVGHDPSHFVLRESSLVAVGEEDLSITGAEVPYNDAI